MIRLKKILNLASIDQHVLIFKIPFLSTSITTGRATYNVRVEIKGQQYNNTIPNPSVKDKEVKGVLYKTLKTKYKLKSTS